MPKSIKQRRRHEAIRSALLGAALLVLCAALCAGMGLSLSGWGRVLLLGLALLLLVPLPFIPVVLKERLKEIEGGDWNAAGQY